MDFNYALNSVGKFGKYQKILTFLLCLPILIECMHFYVQVFAAGESDHWCQSWKDENFKDLNLSDIQCKNPKKETSVPVKVTNGDEIVFEQCEKYNASGTDLETAMLAEKNNYTTPEKIPCDEGWIHNKSTFPSTIIIDLAITIPYVPVLVLEFLFVLESPLWFIAKENIEEADKVLDKVAIRNGKKCTDSILKSFESNTEVR
ncbi:Carcinine transporter [Holothuria leucospilota]|uniref:Carcinine transporter n=1 Tax=Holothuria leucospilota TaxID=206669 RepID=A0A9Q1BDD5_HOLLE|nr:Carcinine transporter [Holothuria leucospilota]